MATLPDDLVETINDLFAQLRQVLRLHIEPADEVLRTWITLIGPPDNLMEGLAAARDVLGPDFEAASMLEVMDELLRRQESDDRPIKTIDINDAAPAARTEQVTSPARAARNRRNARRPIQQWRIGGKLVASGDSQSEQMANALSVVVHRRPKFLPTYLASWKRKRKYIAKSREELNNAEHINQAKLIPGTDYWVTTLMAGHQKEQFVREVCDAARLPFAVSGTRAGKARVARKRRKARS
jgi:negative regulator of replication initiation